MFALVIDGIFMVEFFVASEHKIRRSQRFANEGYAALTRAFAGS